MSKTNDDRRARAEAARASALLFTTDELRALFAASRKQRSVLREMGVDDERQRALMAAERKLDAELSRRTFGSAR